MMETKNKELQKRMSLLDPAIIFLIVGFILGVFYCIAIPYGAGFDEEAHIVRIYDISGSNLLPNRNPPTFKHTLIYNELHDLSYQRRDFQTPAFDMLSPEGLSQRFSRTEESILYGYLTNSIHSPVMFLPQAVIARVSWRTFDFPIVPVVILMRLAGLLGYLAAGWLAIKLLPFGKWILLALALSPMALFQAATLNTDGFLNGVSFLFIALTLFLYVKAEGDVKPGWVWALFGVSLLLGCGKLGAVVLLPLLLLPMTRLKSKKQIAILVAGALLGLFINVGWTALALPGSRLDGGTEHDPSDTISLVLSQPGQFLLTFVQSLASSFGLYTRNWMASYGYWVGDVPPQVYWFETLLLIVSALMLEPARQKFPRLARLYVVGMFLLCAGVVVGLYFTLHYTPGVISEMRQGRYLVPYAPLLFIPLSGLLSVPERWQKWLKWVALACILVALSYYSFGLYATYYTHCGYTAYAGGKCTLPIYKNLEITFGRETELTPKKPIRQGITVLCTGLEEVQVFLKTLPKKPGGTLIFSLLSRDGTKLASQSFPADQLHPGEYLSLSVPSQPRDKGASYELLLEARGVAAPDGFRLLIQPGERYDGGQLFVAGDLVKADLVHHYVCTNP